MPQSVLDVFTMNVPKKKFDFKKVKSSSINLENTAVPPDSHIINKEKAKFKSNNLVNSKEVDGKTADGLSLFINKQTALLDKKKSITRGNDSISSLVSLRTVGLISSSKTAEEKKEKQFQLSQSIWNKKERSRSKNIGRNSSNSSIDDFEVSCSSTIKSLSSDIIIKIDRKLAKETSQQTTVLDIGDKKKQFTFKKLTKKPVTCLDDLNKGVLVVSPPKEQFLNPITSISNLPDNNCPIRESHRNKYKQLYNPDNDLNNKSMKNIEINDLDSDDLSKLDFEMSQEPSTSRAQLESTKEVLNSSIEDYDRFLIENIDWDSNWGDGSLDKPSSEKTKLDMNTTSTKISTNLNTYKQCDWTSVFEPIEQSSSKHTPPSRKDNTEEFRGVYPYSEVMTEVLHSRFGLQTYRPNQEEIINSSLAQHDCFVLMPTGGGKSLCYQLPAVLTPGVTIVISPLRALISDQVDKLNALDIPAAHMCSDVSKIDTEVILAKLSQKEPSIKLLYLTPEKIVASRNTCDMLKGLHGRGKLARFIIDECHCLSQWGHDFRPDYKKLSTLRKNYPGVPIMCLTATATNLVQQDVLNILKLTDVKTFIRSFNRPNIKYKVLPKTTKTITQDIATLIKSKFIKKSGIIYCLGRNDCDSLAKDLASCGIKAKSYHAGMADKAREKVQRDWMNDIFQVIVATIAFGMGIDKPDVRFVIHNSVPKSVEAFYQESGRGGRDGEPSYSFLFYSYSDVVRLQKLIRFDRKVTKTTLEGHFDSLQQMAQYCENKVDCRRYLQLLHLGEKFDRQICIDNKDTTCDNCENSKDNELIDITTSSREIAQIVKDVASHDNFTMLHIVDVYKGSKIKKIIDKNHNKHKFYGGGSHMDKNHIHRILKELMFKKVLMDFCTYNGEFPIVYTKPGPNYSTLFNSNTKLTISVEKNATRKETPIKPNTLASTSTCAPPIALTSDPVLNTSFKISNIKVQCHEDLLEACRNFALERNSTLSSIMNLSAIKTMSEILPNTPDEFLKIQHVTKANFDKFGTEFLRITTKYRKEINKLKLTDNSDIHDASFGSGGDDWSAPKKRRSTTTKKRGTKRKFNSFKFKKGGTKGASKWKKKKT